MDTWHQPAPRPPSPSCLVPAVMKRLTQHRGLESPCAGNEQTSQEPSVPVPGASPGRQQAANLAEQGAHAALPPRHHMPQCLCTPPPQRSSGCCSTRRPAAQRFPSRAWSRAQTPGDVCEAGRDGDTAEGRGTSLVWTATGGGESWLGDGASAACPRTLRSPQPAC